VGRTRAKTADPAQSLEEQVFMQTYGIDEKRILQKGSFGGLNSTYINNPNGGTPNPKKLNT